MGREVDLLKIEENKEKKAIAEILRQIAEKIERGNLTMRQGTGTFVVDFLEDMTLEIKAVEEQKQKVKFSFQLEFFVAYHGQDSIAIG